MSFSDIMIIKTITYTLTIGIKAIYISLLQNLVYINEAEHNAYAWIIPNGSLIGE